MEWLWATEWELARQVLQRGVAAVFFVAFLSTFNQFPALLGERGLLPVAELRRRIHWQQSPSIFLWRYSDRMLRLVCAVGMLVALTLVVGLPQAGPPWLPMVAFLLLWVLYLSVVNVGQTFYGFGWESLLLEAGFLAAFLGSQQVPPPATVIVFFWWLLFRLEFGAGMIKMRGGAEWRDLTALEYHHETQPMPGPLSRYAHLLPRWVHRAEAIGSHFAQLVLPWFVFAPLLSPWLLPTTVTHTVALAAAVIILGTQLWLVATGNFAWLNWLAIVIAFSAVPDTPWLEPAVGWLRGLGIPGLSAEPAPVGAEGAGMFGVAAEHTWFAGVVLVTSAVLLLLSVRPLQNLLTSRQLMNASFNRLHLVNAYGAFGNVTKDRYEVIIEGRSDAAPVAVWREYEFKGKPGDPTRVPRQFAPYHLRLDWMLWFLALGRREPWFDRLLLRLLQGDRAILRLLRHNPFPDAPPDWVRARVFIYRFATRQERRETGFWWMRSEVAELVGPIGMPGRAGGRAAR